MSTRKPPQKTVNLKAQFRQLKGDLAKQIAQLQKLRVQLDKLIEKIPAGGAVVKRPNKDN